MSVVAASESYFRVLGVPLVSGRAFTPVDGMPGREAAIVNQRFVRMFFPTRSRSARVSASAEERRRGSNRRRRDDGAAAGRGPEPDPVVFLPFRTASSPTSVIVARTTEDPLPLSRCFEARSNVSIRISRCTA